MHDPDGGLSGAANTLKLSNYDTKFNRTTVVVPAISPIRLLETYYDKTGVIDLVRDRQHRAAKNVCVCWGASALQTGPWGHAHSIWFTPFRPSVCLRVPAWPAPQVSIDIEGAELPMLEAWPFHDSRFCVEAFTIENNDW